MSIEEPAMTRAKLSGLSWCKSSRSSTWGNCVEVAFADQAVAARDSKQPNGAVLAFSRTDWTCFLQAIRTDRFQG